MPQIPVQPPLRRAARRWLRSAGAALAAFLLVTCSTDSPVGPGRRGIGSLQLAPVFDAFARVAPLTLDNVRVIVVRAPAETLAVVPKSFNPNSNQLQLNIPIFLQSVSEDLLVTLELYSGSTLLFSGTRTLRVTQGSASPPDSIPVAYQGPGSQVASVLIAPRDTTVSFGAVVPYSVNALDGQAQPVAQYYVSWSTVGAPSGTSIDGSGRLTVPSQRDTFFVKVATPNGVVDSTSVVIAASPSALVKAGGDGQSALAGTALPQLLAVQVNGSDGLPVPGATVTFAAGIGAGTVDSATATSDAQGIARSGAVLGSTVGAQTFIASAAGLTAVTFNETATSATGSVTWTGATDGSWATASNWNPAGVPLATNDVVIPPGTPHNPGFSNNVVIHNLTIQTGASLDLNDNNLLLSGNLDASGSLVGCCTETVMMAVSGSVRGNFSDIILDIPAGVVVTLSGTTTLTNNSQVSIEGELVLNGNLLDVGVSDGRVTTNVLTGLITMTNAADQLITRDMTFNGGDETGHLTAGSMFVGGNFSQTGPGTTFVGTGNFTVFFNGAAAQTINFAAPGFAAAHFQNVIVANSAGLVQATSDLYATGTAGVTPTAVRTLSGNGGTLFTTILNVSNFTFNNLLLNFAGSTVVAFDTVTFAGYSPSATPLTIAHPGAASPLSFLDVTFAVTPTTGFYLRATDTNPSDGVPLVIDMINPAPLSDGGFVQQLGGAVVNWPAGVSPGTWTGAVDTSWFTAGNWAGGSVPTTATDVVIPSGTPRAPAIASAVASAHNLQVLPGATLSMNLGGLNLSGSLDAQGTISGTTTSVNLTGTGTVRGTLTGTNFTTLVNGTYTLNGRLVTPGVTVNGTLTLGGFTAVVGSSVGDDFQTSNNGVLVMTNAADSLIVGGTGPSLVFDGGSTAGTLTAGVILMNSGTFATFSQGNTFNASSFAPTGSHKVVLAGGGSINITMATPGSGSAFNVLDLSAQTAGLSLSTAVQVNGLLVSTPVSTAPAINGGGHLLTAGGGTQITGLTLTNAPFRMSGGSSLQFDNVTFQSMATTATQLSVDNVGATPFTFNSLVFSTVPTTGLYLAANDLDGATPNALTINMVGATPAAPSPSLFSATNGAVINWPAAGPVTTWTGTTSTDWSTATNWSTGVVPTNANDVVIPSGTPNPPSVTVSCSAKSLTVSAGATLSIGAFNCQVGGHVFADGSITGSGAIQIATTAQLRGNVPNLILSGPVTLVGSTQVAGTATISSGDFIIGGHAVQISGSLITQGTGLLTMTSPFDTVLVAGVGSFGGGDETGHLTAGYLKIGGSFTQTSANSGASFAASGAHRTEIGAGAVRIINFATPGAGAGTSHFNDLIVNGAGGGINLAANTFVNGQLISHPTGATPQIGVVTAPKVLTVGGVDVSALIVDQNVMTIGAGTITQFDNVAFIGQANGVTQLTVANAGTATPVTFNGLSFAVTPTTGLYLAANDLDGATPNALTINMVGATPAAPSPSLFSATNGAVINWPGAGPVKTWTGASGTDWFTVGNWSPGGVPSVSDSVVIGPATAAPTLTANVSAGSIVVTSGSPVLNGHTMTVARGFATSGSGTVTMQNPLDSLIVLGSVRFDGGDESSLLTAGIVLVSGNFSQLASTSPRSFAPSGTQIIGFNGAGVQTISFASPGPGSSGFHGLGISNPAGGITLASDVYISGGSAYVGAAPKIVHGGGHTIQFQQINVDGVTFDNALVNLTNGTFVNFDNNTFQNYAPTATVLTMSDPGAATPFTFNNLVFSVVPTTGFYLHADDNVSDANVLTIDMANPTPATSGGFVSTTNGAIINWPAAGPVITWTGAISTDWSNAANWSPTQVPTSLDDVVIPPTTLKPAITSTCAAKSILVNSGGRIDLGTLNCQVSGNVTSSGVIAGTSGAIQIVAAGQIQGNFPNIIASAPVTVSGATGLGSGNGNLTISGVGASLTMNGQTLVMPGSLLVQGAGVLIMNNPADVLTVQNGAAFDGGNESGLLTAGTLTIFNSFSQAATSSANSFLASGTHLTALGGQAVTVAFATPASSHFQELDVSGAGGTLTLGSDVTVAGQLKSVVGGLNGPVVSGPGFTLTAGGADISAPQGVSALTMDGVPLVLSGGAITNVASVTFQNQSQTGTALTVNNVGTAAPFTFANLTFIGSLSAGGFWIQANDLDGPTPFPLVIDVIGSNPATGAGVSQANNGAIINWPPVGSLVWTGTVSQDWSTAGNWDLNRVPTSVDDATIGTGTPFQPKLSVSSAINNLTIQAGVVVDLDTTIMVVGGNLDNNGSISGLVDTSGLTLVGTGKTVHGSIGVDVVIPGSYTMNGNFDVLSMSLANSGSLVLNGHQLTTTATFTTVNNGILTMTNAADVLTVGGSALFAGGDETGKLTAGLLTVAGDFNQAAFTVPTSFTASGTHLTQFNGTGVQTIAMQDSALSFFQDLQITNTAGVTVNSLLRVQGNLDIGAGTTISALNGAPFFPGFNVLGNVTTGSGSTLDADRLFVAGTLSASGSFGVTQTIFTGSGQTAPSNLAYQQLWAYGTVTMAPGPLTVTGLVVALPGASLTLSGTTAVGGNVLLGNLGGGSLKLNGQQVLVTGSLTVDGSASLTMQSANDSLVVGGTANFIGGSETGLMTAGVLELQGGLKQTAATSNTSFAPSGTHKTVINSATAQLLDFGSPGAGAAGSHFQVLDLSGATGGASLTVNTIADSVISTSASAKLIGGGASLTMRRAQISGLTSVNAPLVLDEQGLFSTENLSNIDFQSFGPTSAHVLTISGPGNSFAPRPAVSTINVNFNPLGVGANNLYMSLTSTNSQAFSITMTGSNQSPQLGGNGPSLTQTIGGAVVNWP